MSRLGPFRPPHVTDADVNWVCDLLRLPKKAFSGRDGKDPRLEILKSNETMDIEACPGSGKTTLLVAKLAILARKWTESCRGICVLSHTNVARCEIEKGLGGTMLGKRLLSYPHFVGTIHNFVNRFLAIPWLRSKPYPIQMIDDEACQTYRWNILPFRIRSGLERNKHSQTLLRIVSNDFSVGPVRWGKKPDLNTNTETYKAIQRVCKVTSEQGFFCYDEMFVWGNELLDQVPAIQEALRKRFPLLFIDEVQDNSQIQSEILFRVFVEGGSPVIRQRFGDSNQAIYQHASQTKGATTDPFPDERFRRDVPNSYRFGQDIANLADPLAPEPQNLVGLGPRKGTFLSNRERECAIFLFGDQTIGNVIPTYAEYLAELFSERELETGTFKAIGAVHRPSEAEDDKLPRFVGHYWPDYDYELTSVDPKPKTFHQYVLAGRGMLHSSGEVHFAVEKIAEGILRLVALSNPLVDLGNKRRKHRQILELLPDDEQRKSYLDLVTAFGLRESEPTPTEWTGGWLGTICQLARAIGKKPVNSHEARRFLKWQTSENILLPEHRPYKRDNVFRYPADEPRVRINVGSIHSAKGETHTSTLVLETFYHTYSLKTLKPWLLGKKSGEGKEGVRNVSRLKQHYVAITRPSYLLCLAMREDSFDPKELTSLKARWRLARVTDSGPVWL